MTASTHIAVVAHPDLKFRVKMRALDFQVGGEASFELQTGKIHVRFDEIPISVAIPFLARRVIAGSVGPFGVHLNPFEAKFRAFGFDARGVLGRENAEAEVHTQGDCKAEIVISGKLADQVVKAAIKNIAEE